MNAENKYAGYTVEDFVQDADFRSGVLSCDEISTAYQKNLTEIFPHQRKAIEQAYQIVKALVIEEKAHPNENFSDSLEFLIKHLSRKTRRKKLSLWWSRAAAILLLPLLMAGVHFYSKLYPDESPQTIRHIVPDGEKSKVVLNDGTSIWLNSGSTLSYQTNAGCVREVSLTGEAFFDVVKIPDKPFLVKTKDYTVEVYGTQFNVRAYDGRTASETILKEGIVTISLKNQKTVKLEPGQRFSMNHENRYEISTVNPDLYLNWKDQILKISNEALEDLIIRMERWYGVKIRVEDFERVRHLRYTLTIKTESLREMLALMNYVTPFSFEINGEDVVLNYHKQ
ncbi:MAG: FecR domain-containing protein [Mangrovibacterium sp.]|nr:FecR domain-containing protein [Mangrovibacterium sp.]